MLKNYFVTALHNFLNNKLYSFINIFGLAIGLAACIAILLYVDGELSYDKHWQDADRIYRVNDEREFPNFPYTRGRTTANPVLSALKKYYPTAIEAGTRVEVGSVDLVVEGTAFQELITRVDKDFNQLFQLDVITGSLEQTLATVNQLALREDVALKLFGTTDVIGELVSDPGKNLAPARDYTVTAVYRFPDENTVLSANMLTLIDDNLRNSVPQLNNWAFTLGAITYLKLHPSADLKSVESRLPDFINRNANFTNVDNIVDGPISAYFRLRLQAIRDVHLNPWSEVDKRSSGNLPSLLVFIVIAVLVLIIACTNFILMSTAKSSQRAREVAVRKVMGAKRTSIVWQFLTEALAITCLSAFLSVVLLELILPYLSGLVDRELSFNYQSYLGYAFFIIGIISVGVLCGLYPAFVMSSGKPSKTLNGGRSNASNVSTGVRNLLVVFQFSLSVALLVATAFVYLQGRHAISSNLGFNPQNLIVIENLDFRAVEQNQLLKTEIDKLPKVKHSSLSFSRPAQSLDGPNTSQPVSVLGNGNNDASGIQEKISLAVNTIDPEFFSTYQIPLLAGRTFDDSFSRDLIPRSSFIEGADVLEANVLINKAAAHQLGFTSANAAIGQTLQGTYALANGDYKMDFTVIGVVDNTRFHKPRGNFDPEIFFYDLSQIFNLTIRYEEDLAEVLRSVTNSYESVMQSAAIQVRTMDTILGNQFQDIQAQSSMLGGFSMLAILLACLGLLGTSVYFIERRTKEIGIRKIMGAQVKQLVKLLLWQFSKPVILANAIAYPLAILVMLRWLEGFNNQINSLWLLPLCVVAGVLSLSCLWMVVVGSTLRIAKQNPIVALRYE